MILRTTKDNLKNYDCYAELIKGEAKYLQLFQKLSKTTHNMKVHGVRYKGFNGEVTEEVPDPDIVTQLLGVNKHDIVIAELLKLKVTDQITPEEVLSQLGPNEVLFFK